MESTESRLNRDVLGDYISHYNGVAEGRNLHDFLADEAGITELVASMLSSILIHEGKADMIPEIGPWMAEATSIGIWIAEIGKTRMLKEKEVSH